jgi:host factor-I protein
MPQIKEGKGQNPSSPNIQDVFLNYARRERLAVNIRLVDGGELQGRIKNFDRFALIVEHNGADHMIFKHAIAHIKSPRTIGNYYTTHEA